MTVAELHEILDDENKIISLKEYQEILFQLKHDCTKQIADWDYDIISKEYQWYTGEMNGFQIALDLSEHINPNQKVIECLKEVKDLINKDFTIAEDYWKVTDIIDTKIKELEGGKE